MDSFSKTQRDYAHLMNHACYVMCIAHGVQEDFLALLSRGLSNGCVQYTGWVADAAQLSGLSVDKVQFPSTYTGPTPKFTILELDHGKHFVMGRSGAEQLTAPTPKEDWVAYDPAGKSLAQTITGLRVFY